MDKKIKLLAVVSLIAVMTTGCSRNAGATADGSNGYSSSGGVSSQMARTGQVARTGGGLWGQQRSQGATCAPCAANQPPKKQTYTYKPAPRTYKPAPRPAGQHSQQWYVDRWKRQQQQTQRRVTAPAKATTSYGNNYDAGNSNATYYDYSSAGRAKNTAASNNTTARTNNTANVSTSNKSIYTGSYQQKTYKPYSPTTYSGGSSATTNTTTYASSAAKARTGGSTYIVKKGDTVFEIMRQTGVYWKDIIKLNNLQAPAYNINPGQAIRLK